MKKKTCYTSEFKAKVVMESISGKMSNVELCSKYKIPITTFNQWLERAKSNFSTIFVPESEYDKEKKSLNQNIENLHKIIGEITIENNYLKKKLQQ